MTPEESAWYLDRLQRGCDEFVAMVQTLVEHVKNPPPELVRAHEKRLRRARYRRAYDRRTRRRHQ